MTETFVDSSFWIALLNPRDAMHGMARHGSPMCLPTKACYDDSDHSRGDGRFLIAKISSDRSRILEIP